jgi:hypothetical protein
MLCSHCLVGKRRAFCVLRSRTRNGNGQRGPSGSRRSKRDGRSAHERTTRARCSSSRPCTSIEEVSRVDTLVASPYPHGHGGAATQQAQCASDDGAHRDVFHFDDASSPACRPTSRDSVTQPVGTIAKSLLKRGGRTVRDQRLRSRVASCWNRAKFTKATAFDGPQEQPVSVVVA